MNKITPPELQKKVEQAVRLIQAAARDTEVLEVSYSGGKDSDVILELTRMADVPHRAIYKNTTIDPPGTVAHARARGAEVRMPEKNFITLVHENGIPNRFYRFCCRFLKEYKVLDKAVIGVRKSESNKRKERYTEPTECKYYGAKRPENHIEAIYPILDWTDEDVERFLEWRGVKCAPVYYDEEGRFHVERRLGCMCCPLKSFKKRLADFEENPRMARVYLRAAQRFRELHPDSRHTLRYKDVYEWFAREVFFEKQHHWEAHKASLFGDCDYKQMISERLKIDLSDLPF